MHVAARLTTEEFLRLEEPPMLRFELLDGELVVTNSPAARHQHAVLQIASALNAWCRAAKGRGITILDISTDLGVDTVLRPDVQWFPAERTPTGTELPGPIGDIAVEVASPGTVRHDERTKVPRYLARGAREVWLVDPVTPAIEIRTRADGAPQWRGGPGATLTTPLLPGFALDVGDLAYPHR